MISGASTPSAAPRPAWLEADLRSCLLSHAVILPVSFCLEQNGPIRGRRPGPAELGGRRLRPHPKPRWRGRVHRWHLPSLQADQSAACTHHGPVQPHPGQGELLHRQQVSLHLWGGQRGQEVRKENHRMAISFLPILLQITRVRCKKKMK